MLRANALKARPDSNFDSKPQGLRIKVGVDIGRVSCSVHAALGRATYRGRVMNRAARVCGLCKSGQVRLLQHAPRILHCGCGSSMSL